ncbi:MAG: pyridoxal-phosphate dependent enzyme, partial [Bacteroidota bacterium]
MLLSSQSNPPIWKPFLTACREDILYQSRVHRLRSFEREGTEVWLKREDESGFGTSGSKKRKIASLLPWLKQQDIQRLGIIGGARSNHVVSLLQWAREESLEVRCLLKASQTPAEGGNAMLLRLLCEEREIRWLSAEEWPVAEEIAEKEFGGEDAYIVQEGGYCAAAVAGAATLLMDIERNEQALGGAFDQIVIDAGTGLSAAVLCCINAWRERKTEIHVVLTAGTIQTFGEAVAKVGLLPP